MKDPVLSFCIPAHNAEAWLAEAIQSCLVQTQKAIEVIVVDDFSTDSTRSVIDWFVKKDDRVFLGPHIGEPGRGGARNSACAFAKAPVLAMLDADDISDRMRAARTMAAFVGLATEAYIHGGAEIIDVCLQSTGRTYIPELFDLSKALARPGVEFGIIHSTVAFPKTLWERFKFDEGEYQAIGLDDWQQQARIAKAGIPIIASKDVLCGYRPLEGGTVAKRDQAKVAALKKVFLEEIGLVPLAA